jgi:hypothetical protein
MLLGVHGEVVMKRAAGVIIVLQLAILRRTGMEKIAHGAIIIAIKMGAGNITITKAIVLMTLQPKD